MKIPITKPYFDKTEERAVVEVLRSGWVTQGPKVSEFEEIFARYVGTKYAVATTSATTALFLSLHVLGIERGDEVIVPSFSFIATANAVVHVGAKPVFVDIDPKTYNIDPKLIEAKITKRTKAIIPVDQVGVPCDIEAIKKIAKKHRLYVIEDAACAIGSRYKGKPLGNDFDTVCFSFHPRKIVTTGDGGMITTNSKKIADKIRLFRHQGMGVSDITRHKSSQIIHEDYPVIGYNFRMTDIQAAVGIQQFRKLPKFLKKRKHIAKEYTRAFKNSKLLIPPFIPKESSPNWQSYLTRLRKNKRISREVLMQKLLDLGISTRFGIMAIHQQAPYKKMYPKLHLPETESATRETICLPIYHQMTNKEQAYIINQILKITKH